MILLAHIFGLPLEEALGPLASGAATGTAVWVAAMIATLRSALR
jgi:hypothetical protein